MTNKDFKNFLYEVKRRKKCSASQMAKQSGISHTAICRWLYSNDVPCIDLCPRLAEYCGISVNELLAIIGYIPRIETRTPAEWPEFREYAQKKYPDELDEEIISMIEDLIKRRRARRTERTKGITEG